MTTAPATGSTLALTAEQLLLTQLKSSGPLPAGVQRAIWQLVRNAGNADELRQVLVARTDTPADLIDEFRRITDPDLRVRFLSRPGHDEAFLRTELAAEHRIVVLTALLQASRRNESLLNVVCDKFLARPSVALATALVTTCRRLLPDAVTVQVFTVLAPRFDRLTKTAQRALSGLAEEIIGSDRDTVARIAMIVAPVPKLAVYFHPVRWLPGHVRRVLLDAIRVDPDVDRRVMSLTALLNAGDLQPEVLAQAREVTSELGVATRDKLARALARNEPVPADRTLTLDELIRAAQAGDDDAMVSVVCAPNAPVPVRVDLVARVARVGMLASRAAAVAGTAENFPEPVLDALVLRDPSTVIELCGWEIYPDPLAAQIRVIKAALAVTASTDKLRAVLRAGVDAAALRRVPWRALPPRLAGTDVRFAATLTQVAAVQLEVLAEDPVRWEIFAGLADTFDGTFGELLDTAAALANGGRSAPPAPR